MSIFPNLFYQILMCDIFDLMRLFDHLLYFHLLRQFRVFCDVNWTSYSWCPLKEGIGSDGPRQRIFSGIHRRCRRDKAPPTSLVEEKKRIMLAATPYGELSQFLFPLYQMQCVSSQPFCCVSHMRFGLLCGDANVVTFWYLGEGCLTGLSLTLLTCFSLSISKHIFYPIDWLAYTSSPCRHGKTSFESSVLSPCLSTSSCQPHQHQTRSAPDKVKLKHTLSLYIDKMSRLSRDKAPSKSSIQSALSRERITLKLEKRLKMKQLFFLPTLCLKEGKGEIILKWVVSV